MTFYFCVASFGRYQQRECDLLLFRGVQFRRPRHHMGIATRAWQVDLWRPPTDQHAGENHMKKMLMRGLGLVLVGLIITGFVITRDGTLKTPTGTGTVSLVQGEFEAFALPNYAAKLPTACRRISFGSSCQRWSALAFQARSRPASIRLKIISPG
ncbi:MAG: hypothetical protein AB8B51_04895 [Sedimentitalea sp.]